jgi:hypothetical protein
MKNAVAALVALAGLVAGPASALADCKCRANGKIYHHGEVACLKLPGGAQLAQCGMVLNNSAWKKIADGCPEVSLDPAALPPMSLPVQPIRPESLRG